MAQPALEELEERVLLGSDLRSGSGGRNRPRYTGGSRSGEPTADYVRKLRQALPAAFPEDIFYSQAADMVTQILNFGVTAQIDVRTVGYDRIKNLHIASSIPRARRVSSTFIKFHWKPKLCLQSVVWNEAAKLNGADPDYHRRGERENRHDNE